jgi:hypothetical protein
MTETPGPVDVVYIAGSSYSGSTLLGLIVSAAPGIFYPGEVKVIGRGRVILRNDYCTCGEHYTTCVFWSNAVREIGEPEHLLETSLRTRASVLLRAAFSRSRARDENGEDRVLRNLLAFAERFHGRRFHSILDSSKGIWRLDRLASNPHVRLRVIHVTRSIARTAASYRKREGSFLRGFATTFVHNLLIRRYLRRMGIEHLDVAFEQVLEDEAATIARIGAFLGVAIPADGYVEAVRAFPHHVLGGNPMRFRYGARLDEFRGIEK